MSASPCWIGACRAITTADRQLAAPVCASQLSQLLRQCCDALSRLAPSRLFSFGPARAHMSSVDDGRRVAALTSAGSVGGVAAGRAALSVVPLFVQLSRDNARRLSPTRPVRPLSPAEHDKHAQPAPTRGKRPSAVHRASSTVTAPQPAGPRADNSDASDGSGDDQPASQPVKRARPAPSAGAAAVRSFASSYSSLLCSESLPAELRSSALCPPRPSERLAADYEQLLDRCYALSCRTLTHQHDNGRLRMYVRALQADRTANPHSRSQQHDTPTRGHSECAAAVAERLLALGLHTARSTARHRRGVVRAAGAARAAARRGHRSDTKRAGGGQAAVGNQAASARARGQQTENRAAVARRSQQSDNGSSRGWPRTGSALMARSLIQAVAVILSPPR